MPIKTIKEDSAFYLLMLRFAPFVLLCLGFFLMILATVNWLFIFSMLGFMLVTSLMGAFLMRFTAARAVTRLLYLLPPAAFAVLILISGIDLVANQEVGGLDALQYCLCLSCMFLLPMLLFLLPGVSLASCDGRAFDNNVLRLYTVATTALLCLTCFYFNDMVLSTIFANNYTVSLSIDNVFFSVFCCCFSAAVMLLSFAAFPPFQKLTASIAAKRAAKRKNRLSAGGKDQGE